MSSPQPHLPVEDPRSLVATLLARASTYPCSTAAAVFSRLAQSTSTFQLALDTLLPALDPPDSGELADRILISFILFALYAPHPITMNPFKSVMFVTFVKEREMAVAVATAGGIAPNEQLVWVLWKILKGDGQELGSYSPSSLARLVLPPNLRATELAVDAALLHSPPALCVSFAYINARQTLPAPSRLPTPADDERTDAIAHAMRLLLAARTRALTFSEQRQLTLHGAALAAAPLIAEADIAPLAAHNPGIAGPLFAALLAGPPGPAHATLRALTCLPPTLPTFDVLGRLLHDVTPLNAAGPNTGATVGELVCGEVLGPFVAQSISRLEQAAREEREGLVSDDRFAQGVQHLCRFYHSLIKRGLIDVSNDADTAAMAHFSLVHARFEEANALYRALAARAEIYLHL
ncbi:hypothetical protein GGX14DRAFT_370817 [Mycena pura]|uniref:CCR4-NOT transcription complex subunit 11 n=1 Tax=Mycena pura TaxID=153505 RepID=A0AAD6YC58_9AGAR|nr:hypothetical protein GGX14DRAFT_370817 [Mycena pura]